MADFVSQPADTQPDNPFGVPSQSPFGSGREPSFPERLGGGTGTGFGFGVRKMTDSTSRHEPAFSSAHSFGFGGLGRPASQPFNSPVSSSFDEFKKGFERVTSPKQLFMFESMYVTRLADPNIITFPESNWTSANPSSVMAPVLYRIHFESKPPSNITKARFESKTIPAEYRAQSFAPSYPVTWEVTHDSISNLYCAKVDFLIYSDMFALLNTAQASNYELVFYTNSFPYRATLPPVRGYFAEFRHDGRRWNPVSGLSLPGS